MAQIDCIIVGHNEMDFVGYVRTIKDSGASSGAYRDLSLNYIMVEDTPTSATDAYNLMCSVHNYADKQSAPLSLGDTFSNTIGYLGTYLNRRGFSFEYINSFRDEQERFRTLLTDNTVNTIAITTTLYVTVLPILDIIDFVRRHNKTVKIIVGGPYVSTQVRLHDDNFLSHLFKSTIKGDVFVNSSQGEDTLVKLLQSVRGGESFHHIENIYYVEGDALIKNPVKAENNALSENLVDWSLFGKNIRSHVNIRTAVSCPYTCSFCGFPEHAGAYQTVDPSLIIMNEFDRLQSCTSAKSLNIIDDTYNVPPKRFKEICTMMVQRQYRFKWHSYYRCQFADDESVALMKESGCEGVFLGIESGSEEILLKMKKHSSIDKYMKGIELLKKYGILTFGSFILGFPGETEKTIEESKQFIKNSGLDFYRAQLWYCDRITPIWKERETYGIKGSGFEWEHNTMNSKDACDALDQMFLEIDDPVWVPQYNFDFENLFHLIHRGLSIADVKSFLTGFTAGIKDRIRHGDSRNISIEALQEMSKPFMSDAKLIDESYNKNVVANFDF